jgi:exoribonuclease II
MRIKIMMVFIACLFLSFSKPNYPVIYVYAKITDKTTGKILKGAKCVLDITYQTKECLPWSVKPFEEYSNRNTFKMDTFAISYALRHPIKKYAFEVNHKDYKPVIKRDSFDKCGFELIFDIALEKEQ